MAPKRRQHQWCHQGKGGHCDPNFFRHYILEVSLPDLFATLENRKHAYVTEKMSLKNRKYNKFLQRSFLLQATPVFVQIFNYFLE